MNVNNYKLTNQ